MTAIITTSSPCNQAPKSEASERRRRSRPVRVERSDCLVFVTTRTIEEVFWLHPLLTCGAHPPSRRARRALASMEHHCDKRMARVVERAHRSAGPYQPRLTVNDAKRMAKGAIGSVLARAQERFGVEIFSLVVMSNHLHLVLRTPNKNLAAFMEYFKRMVTGVINRLTGRRGPLWARRYDAQPILDDEAACDRVAYCVANPSEAGLVDDPQTWPGLNLAYGLCDAERLDFEYLDVTAWHKARRPKDLSPFFKTATLTILPLPAHQGAAPEAYREAVLDWVKQRSSTPTSKEPSTGHALGVAKVIHAPFEQRPHRPKRTRRPYCFGSTQARYDNFEQMSALLEAHQEASERFLRGDRNALFPEGTYPPPIRQAA